MLALAGNEERDDAPAILFCRIDPLQYLAGGGDHVLVDLYNDVALGNALGSRISCRIVSFK